MLLKSTSQDPQSRSMLCLVRSEVVRGPGVSRYGSVLMGVSAQCEPGGTYTSFVLPAAAAAPHAGEGWRSSQRRRLRASEAAKRVDAEQHEHAEEAERSEEHTSELQSPYDL